MKFNELHDAAFRHTVAWLASVLSDKFPDVPYGMSVKDSRAVLEVKGQKYETSGDCSLAAVANMTMLVDRIPV